MCVNTKGYNWERPAVEGDCEVFSKFFPEIDFKGLLGAMSADGAKPLTVDLALIGAMMHSKADDLGMSYVPFSGLEIDTKNVVKLPVMDQIVDWLENSALGTDMWNSASDWCEAQNGTRVHFAMNCGCGLVSTMAYTNGLWSAWKTRFNAMRVDIYGQTTVVRRDVNDVSGLDINEDHVHMWHRMRECLESLPVVSTCDREEKLAA